MILIAKFLWTTDFTDLLLTVADTLILWIKLKLRNLLQQFIPHTKLVYKEKNLHWKFILKAEMWSSGFTKTLKELVFRHFLRTNFKLSEPLLLFNICYKVSTIIQILFWSCKNLFIWFFAWKYCFKYHYISFTLIQRH